MSPIVAAWQRELPTGDCGALACCEAGLAALEQRQAEPGGLQGLVLDGTGRLLDPLHPLWQPMGRGEGLALQLWQREGPGRPWQLAAHCHAEAPPDIRADAPRLAQAIAWLIHHARWQGPLAPATGPILQVRPAAPWQPGRARLVCALTRLSQRLSAQFTTEAWRIGIVDASAHAWLAAGGRLPVHWLPATHPARCHADPMGVPGRLDVLLCETFDERTGLGTIERLQIQADGRSVSAEHLPLDDGLHVSYPLMVEIEGRRLGVLESAARGDCVLHEVDAEGRWQRLGTMISGVPLADSTLFRHEGRWWLATTDLRIGARDNLCLYHADDPLGPWQPHALNPVKLDLAGARMAGPVFTLPPAEGGALVRPGQDGRGAYGRAVRLYRITRLTPTEFSEELLAHVGPEVLDGRFDGLHTVSAWGQRTLIDAKRHVVHPAALARKLRARLGLGPATAPASAGPAKVAVFIPHLRLGGGETALLRLAEGLAREGLEVVVIVHTMDTAELPLPPGVRVHSLGCHGTLAAVPRLARALRALRPQGLLSGFPHTNVAAVLAAALSGQACKVVLSEHAPLSHQIRQQDQWRYRCLPPLLRWAYGRAHGVVAVSHGVGDDLRRLLGRDLPLHVIANPVIDERAAPQADADATPPHPWLLDRQLEVVLSVSRLSPEKNLPVLLQAFAQLQALRPNARLLVAGDGPEAAALTQQVDRLGLGRVVQLVGRVRQPMTWMRQAAAVALASSFEGFGNVLVEALASGTSVVSTDCPVGPREILDHGRFGELVPVGDPSALAQALARTLARGRPPEGAQAHAGRFTVGAAAAAYRRVFDSPQGA